MKQKKTVNITIRVTPGFKAAIQALAEIDRRSTSNFVELILMNGMQDMVKAHPDLDDDFLNGFLNAPE